MYFPYTSIHINLVIINPKSISERSNNHGCRMYCVQTHTWSSFISPIFVSIFFSVAVGLFVPFWYWHWLNKVSTPPLLFSPSCNKNIISFIFPRTLNYWLLIAPIERWSDDPRHSTLDDLSLTKIYFSRTPYLPFFFAQRGPQIRLCVSLIDRRQLRRTSHANLLLVAI